MILDEISYTSELGLQQSTEYPETYYITLKNLATLTACPDCGSRLKPRDDINKTAKIIHDYDPIYQRVIIITMHRKNYRCTKCGRSFTAAEEYNKIFRTEAFDRYIALTSIKDMCGNGALGKRYGFTRGPVSEIVNRQVPILTPLFIPPADYDTFYLYPFSYQGKRRLYLVGTNPDGDSMLLALFGYNDPVAEVRRYLELHGQFLSAEERPLFFTDFDPALIQVIKETLDNPQITILHSLMKDKLDIYKAYSDNTDWNNRDIAVKELWDHLNTPDASPEILKNWWAKWSVQWNVRQTLSPLWKSVSSCMDECLSFYASQEKWRPESLNAQLNLLNSHITQCNKQHVSFVILVIRLILASQKQMYCKGVFAYTADVLTREDSEALSSAVWSKEHPLEVKEFYETMYKTFNLLDVARMTAEESQKQDPHNPQDDTDISDPEAWLNLDLDFHCEFE